VELQNSQLRKKEKYRSMGDCKTCGTKRKGSVTRAVTAGNKCSKDK